VLIYTGMGGQDANTRKHTADQNLDRGNLGLAMCCTRGLPVSELTDVKYPPR
jgi:hypothetical protein